MNSNMFAKKFVDCFYDPVKRLVLGTFLLGFILRVMAARNIGVSADDVNHALRPIGIFQSGKLVIWDQSTALWYYVQGVFYEIFGATMLGSRFAAVFFGSFTIILMFLFVKRAFKSEKAALFASLLVAISPMLIKSSLPEMDVAAAFFVLLAGYFLLGYFESRSRNDLLLTAVVVGVGAMIKLYVLFFGASLMLLLLLREIKIEPNTKKIIKTMVLFGAVIALLSLPSFAHNYLLHKDKGITDYITSTTFKVAREKSAEFYGWTAGWNAITDYKGFFFGNQKNFDPTPVPGFIIVAGFLLKGDPLLFVLGLLGVIAAFKRQREMFWFTVIMFLPAFIYLGSQIPMSKHFIWGLVLLAPCAGMFLASAFDKRAKFVKPAVIIILVYGLLYLGMPQQVVHSPFYSQSSYGQLVDFKEKTIEQNALVVVDSRIYRGHMHWALSGTNYIEAAQFFPYAQELNKQGNAQPITVYYVECAIDDCGWGTIKDQPEFNQTMEDVTAWFANQSYFQKNFTGPDRYDYTLPGIGNRITEYKIYKVDLQLNPLILAAARQTHVWFLYPSGFDRNLAPIFDDYETHTPLDSLINSIAWIIFYLELALAFAAVAYIIYLFVKE